MASHWNTIVVWGLANSGEGGCSGGTQAHDTFRVYHWSCSITWVGYVLGPGTLTWHLPSLITLQILSRSSLWAAFYPSPVSLVKRTRGETPPFFAIPAHSGGPPECLGRVTMATNQPSTSESRSTGGTRSRNYVMLVCGLKWWIEILCRVRALPQESATFCRPQLDLHVQADRPVNSRVGEMGCHLSSLLSSGVFVWALNPLRIPFCFSPKLKTVRVTQSLFFFFKPVGFEAVDVFCWSYSEEWII